MSVHGKDRAWFGTKFQGKEEELTRPLYDPLLMRWHISSIEQCPTTLKMHVQFFVYFNHPVTRHRASTAMGGGVAIYRKGKYSTFANQVTYIEGPWVGKGKRAGESKPGPNPTYVEHGAMPRQGARTDLQDLCDLLRSGDTTLDQILMDHPGAIHTWGRTLEKVAAQMLRETSRDGSGQGCRGTWFWGETGTGKSHRAFNAAPRGETYLWPNDGGWWDQYKQQRVVIMNDFRGDGMKYNRLLQLVDIWPCEVRRRYTAPVPFVSERVIVTSSKSPGQVFRNRKKADNIQQLYRRFDVKRCYFNDEGERCIEETLEEPEVDEEIHFIDLS